MCKKDNIESKQRSSSSTLTSTNTRGTNHTVAITTTEMNQHHHQQQQQQRSDTSSTRGLSPLSVSSNSSSSSSSSNDDITSHIDPMLLQQQEVVVVASNTSSTNNRSGRLRNRFQLTSSSSLSHREQPERFGEEDHYYSKTTTKFGGRDTQRRSKFIETTVISSLSLHKRNHASSSSSSRTLLSFCYSMISTSCLAIMVTFVIVWFSLRLPFMIAPTAAQQTYQYAKYNYNTRLSYFDNTIWTYGTDYFLALCMFVLTYYIPSSSSSSPLLVSNTTASSSMMMINNIAKYTRGLLLSYMISVIAGGIAHEYFTSIELQNTIQFRMIWTICVGAVSIASAFMGSAASSIIQFSNHNETESASSKSSLSSSSNQSYSILYKLPTLSVGFWFLYGISVTAFVIVGQFSYQRPACDIFVVGITQFPSTFYMMFAIYYCFSGSSTTRKSSNEEIEISNQIRCVGCCGFIFNAPLLPLYPLLVQYTNMSLGTINTILHTWLLIAWTVQGLSLRSILTSSIETVQSKNQPTSATIQQHSSLQKTGIIM